MENINIQVNQEMPAQVDSFGYKIRFYTGVGFDDTAPVKLLIQDPEGSSVIRLADLNDADRGEIIYTVSPGDFPIGGTYRLQIIQEGANFRFRSPIILLPVYDSISIP